MRYWRRNYGIRSNDFIKGVIAGITAYAINKNGRQLVGSYETPLKEEIEAVREQLGWREEKA